MKKRILSMLLAIFMVAGMLPTAVFAAEGDNLCAHHTEHTADCGYAPAVEGSPCTHAHDEACGYMAAVEEVPCDCVAAEDGTLTHAEGCGYVEAVAGSDCTHVHDEACGYAAAVEEQPCTYECAECAAVNEEPSEVTAAEITGLALIVDGTEHSSGLVTLTAASTVELKVYGTNLQYGTNDQQIWHRPDADVSLDSVYSWVVSSDGTYATISRDISDFCNIATPYTLQYSNNGKDFYDSNVSVIYDSSEDAAITGVSITVDGETCSSGNVTIYSDSVVTITVAGSNLQNATNDQMVELKSDGTWSISGMTVSDDGTSATLEKTGDDFEGNENFEIRYCNDWITAETWQYTGIYLTYDDGTGDEPAVAATRVIYVDESTFLASGYSQFYDADENLLTATREEQEDGWAKYTVPADAKYYLTFDGHLGGGGGGNYPQLPTNADTYDPFSDTWSCSHPDYTEGNCRLCGEPCPGHTGGTATCKEQAVCDICKTAYGELGTHTAEPTYAPNAEDSTKHDVTYSCCGATVTEDHTLDVTTGKCSACGADMTAIATVTDGTNTYYAADAATLNQAVTAILETGSRTFTVELPADAEAGMITAIRRAICDTEGVIDGSIHLTLKGVTTIPGTTNWDGVAFGPRNAQWDENNVEIVSHEEVTQLASINLPDVTEIGAQAFLNCSNLTSITAPKVQSIGDWGLQSTAITSIDMPLLKEAGFAAFHSTALTEVSLPSLETAGNALFMNCKQLRTVDLPKLQNLSQQLFDRCTSLVSVNVPAATSMRNEVFCDCSELVSITLPGVTELTYGGFAGCTKLENITLGSVITKVNANLFDGEALSSGITLTLNCGQKNAETLPAAAGENVEWAGFTWKEVKFAHSYVNSKCEFCGEDCTHTGGTATCTTPAVCDTCGVSYGEVNANNHNWENGVCTYECGTTHDPHTFENGSCTVCGKEDTTPAEITGISITVDGELYTEGNVTITPNSTVILTVTGTNLHNGSDDHRVDYAGGRYLPVTPDYFEISEDGTVATYEPSAGDFANSSNFEITYCNNDTDTANRTVVPTGIYLTYDDGIAEENRAQITGMSITIDGVVYDSSNTSAEDPAVITPNTEFITITVHGTALQNCTTDHVISYYSGSSQPILADYLWHFEADGTGAYHYYSSASALSDFARNTTPYELQYSNNGSFNAANPAIGSGVYIVYDDSTGGEEDTTLAEITGVSITIDGVVYDSSNTSAENPAVINPSSTVTLTVTGTNLQNGTNDNRVNYADGFGQTVSRDYFEINEDGTTATDAPPVNFFANSSNYEIKYYNNYTDTDNRTAISTGIYLTYDDGTGDDNTGGEEDTTPAQITGVSITVDDVEHTEGDVTITPETESIIVTVTGTHFANLSADNILDLGPGLTIFMNSFRWKIDSAANTATADFSDMNSEFGDHNGTQIMYSNDSNQNWTGTGIYLTYDDGTGGEEDTTPDSTGKILVDMQDSYGDGWNDAAIQIYKNGSLEQTVTVDKTSNTVFLDYDSTATYEFKWIKGGYDYECSFTIYEDGEEKLSVTDASVYENGETIWPQGDTGGEEDTTSAEITGVTVTVDGVPYTSGNVTITPTSTVIFTVTGTNFANLSADNVVSSASGFINPLHNGGWTIDTETNTATQDFSDSISWFDACDNYEVRYSNDGDVGPAYVGTGIYLTYDDSTGGEEDTTPAEITGVSITVDGVLYTEGDVTITPETESIIVTVTGTHFANLSADNILDLGPGLTIFLNTFRWKIDSAANTATADFSDMTSEFGDHNGFEIMYSNDSNQNWTGTGIYLTYDDGIEVNTTLAIGDNEIADGYTYTYTAEQDGSLYITVTELYYGGSGNVNEGNLGSWCAIEINGTAITEFANSTEVKTGDTVTVELISLDNDTYNGTVNLSWGAPVMAEITGVSITIDGEEYVGSDTSAENPAVITSEAASVILTVHGTNLQYATDEQWVSYMSTGNCVTLDNSDWTKSEDGSLASLDLTFLTESFIQSISVWEIKYSNDGGGLEDAVTGLYVKYEHIAGEEEPIVIIQQPTDGEAKLGERYCVEVIAQGEGLKYQWYFRNAGASSFSKSSVTDSTYDDVMTTARMNRQVYCVITDSHGNSVTTDTASLIALKSVDLAITTLPESVTANYGERFTVTAEAVGDGVTYEWYYLDPDGASWLSANVRSATYSGKMSEKIDGRAVYCVAADIWGEMVATNVVMLSCERAELAITQQPNDASAKLGERFNVEVIAQGDGLKYQWYFRKVGVENWSISGVRDNTYDDVMTSARHNREVYCVITDAWGNSVTTDIATITAIPEAELKILAQPNDASAKLNEMFNVEVLAQGDGLKYQWYFRKVGEENWRISGVRDNTYDDVMTSARHNREVYCVITDAWGNSVTTDIATISGIPTTTLAITKQPEDQTVPLGDPFCVTVEAVGDDLKYQWYFMNANADKYYVSGQRDNTYDDIMTSARHERSLYCVITDAWGNSVTTDPIVVIMASQKHELQILQHPNDASAKLGEEFCVTVEAQGDGLQYQWYYRPAGTETWMRSGVRDNTYDDVMTSARHNREVYCVITDMWGHSVTTDIALITGTPTAELAITQQPTDGTAALGETYCVTVEAQGDGLKYQWYFRQAGTTRWSKSGVTDNTYDDVMTRARAGREVYCVITDAWGNSVATEIATLICTDVSQAN